MGFTLRLKVAQKPYIVWSLGPKALRYESLEPLGLGFIGLGACDGGFDVSSLRAGGTRRLREESCIFTGLGAIFLVVPYKEVVGFWVEESFLASFGSETFVPKP